jgi:integrase
MVSQDFKYEDSDVEPEFMEWTEDMKTLKNLITHELINSQKSITAMAMELLANTVYAMYGNTSINNLINRSTNPKEGIVFCDKMNTVLTINQWTRGTEKVIFSTLKKILRFTTIQQCFINTIALKTENKINKNSPEWCLPSKYKKMKDSSIVKKMLIQWIVKSKKTSSYNSQKTIQQFISFVVYFVKEIGYDIDYMSQQEFDNMNVSDKWTMVNIKRVVEVTRPKLHDKVKACYVTIFLQNVLNVNIDNNDFVTWKKSIAVVKNINGKPDHDVHRFTVDEMQKMYESASQNIRDELVYMILITTGMRVGGVSNIKMKDVCQYVGEDLIINTNGRTLEKGKKWFSFNINGRLKEVMHFWIKNHRKSNGDYLIPGRGIDGGLTTNRLSKLVKEIGKKAGVEGPHVHAHSLRHSFAHMLLESGNDVQLIAKLMGHASSKTTEQYYLKESAVEASSRANIPWLNKDECKQEVIPNFLKQTTTQIIQPSTSLDKRKSKKERKMALKHMVNDFKKSGGLDVIPEGGEEEVQL